MPGLRGWHRTLRPLIVAALLLVGLSTVGGAAPPGVAPALPAQAERPVPGSSCPAAQPGTWTRLSTEQYDIATNLTVQHELTVDPWSPCRMYRSTGAQTVERSIDGGRTWEQVFHDAVPGTASSLLSPAAASAGTASAGCSSSFAIAAMLAPVRDTLSLAECGNGDGAVVSHDAGRTWNLMNGGLDGVPLNRIVYAPGDPEVAYATVYQGTCLRNMPVGQPGLYLTRDGGQTWSLVSELPLSCITSVQVDPGDPGRVWIMTSTPDPILLTPVAFVPPYSFPRYVDHVLESRDFGRTFLPVSTLSGGWASGLFVTRSRLHPLRLFFTNPYSDAVLNYGVGSSGVIVSDNDGGTWSATPLPSAGDNNGTGAPVSFAADPRNPDVAIIVQGASGYGAHVAAYLSRDGFDTVAAVSVLPVAGSANVVMYTPLTGDFELQDHVLQADRRGSFYVAVETSCGVYNRDYSLSCQEYWRYTPPAPQPAAAGSVPAPPSTLPVTPPSTAPSSALPLQVLKVCTGPGQGGGVTFDGRDVLYTNLTDPPAEDQGVIHRLDPTPLLCADDGTIVVHFDPRDLDRLCAAYDQGLRCDFRHPVIDDLTYDRTRNVIWVSLADNSYRGTHLFQVRITQPGRPVAQAVARLAFPSGCGAFLAYDASDDTLWTCDGGGNTGHIQARDGSSISTCMGAVDTAGDVGSVATWTVTGGAHLYAQMEDDSTVQEYNDVTCRVERLYAHRPYAEPPEDEQLACDMVSFGPDVSPPSPVLTPALWLREGLTGDITAYAMPDATCRMPTLTTYVGPTRAILGQRLSICASLQRALDGSPLAHLPLGFVVDGAPAGEAFTDAHGVGCVGAIATTTGQVSVQATFLGDFSFTGSSGPGSVLVGALPAISGPPAHVAMSGPPPASAPNAGVSPVTNPVPSSVHAVQAQPQPQQQPQSQAQSQTQGQAAGQPVAMAERQHQQQVQVAVAANPAALQQEGVYEMSALGSSDGVTRVAVETAIAAAGLGLVVCAGMVIGRVLRAPGVVVAPCRPIAEVRRRRRRRHEVIGGAWYVNTPVGSRER